jgi:hypothetical protein
MSRHSFNVIVLLAFFLGVASSVSAQVDPDDPLLLGVDISAEGLLSVRKTADDPKLLAVKKAALDKARKQAKAAGNKPQLTYISLPRLFAEAKATLDAGKELPDHLRYMGGITKLRYIFVFPEEKDLVIAGDAEPYNAANPDRPIGLLSNRPVLRLDDLVTVLRTVGPGNLKNSIGCSIDPPEGAMKIVTDAIADPANRKLSKEKKATAIAEAVGPQTVRYIDVAAETRVAFVCVEADYLLKRMAMGIDPTPAGIVLQHQNDKLQVNRLWLPPNFEPLVVSEDGRAYEIRGQSLQLHARGDQFEDVPATAGTAGYAKNFTNKFPQIAAAVPAFADLWNITDLALLAALIGQDRLHVKAGWKLDWVLSEKGYPVAKVPVIRTADTVAHYRTGAYIVGGVELDFADQISVKRRQRAADDKLIQLLARPTEGWGYVKKGI